MINGLESVCTVFVILAVGCWFTWKEKWPADTNKAFSVAVVSIAAPALAVVSIENRFTPKLLLAAVMNIAVITLTVFLMHALGALLAKIMHLGHDKTAVFKTTFTFNNTMFIGLPINLIVFGHDGLPYLFTYYLVTIVLFWSLGAFTLSKAAAERDLALGVEGAVSEGPGATIKKIFSPGLIGVMIGCALAGTSTHLPVILETSLGYLGDACVPLSLLVIGSNLAKTFKKGRMKITFDMVMIMIGKFAISPLIIFCAFKILGLIWPAAAVTGLPLSVFILTASLPCHAQTAIMCEYYDLESEYASNLVSLSTLISLFTIPIYATILLH